MDEKIASVLYALKLKRVEIEKEEFYDLMRRYQNIYQLVSSDHIKYNSEKRAKLIIKEIQKIIDEKIGKKEELPPKEKLKYLIAQTKMDREKGTYKMNKADHLIYKHKITHKRIVL